MKDNKYYFNILESVELQTEKSIKRAGNLISVLSDDQKTSCRLLMLKINNPYGLEVIKLMDK